MRYWSDRLARVVGQETRNVAPPLRYEVLADRLVHPKPRKSQNKYFVQIDLQIAYPTLILIGINEFCANMIQVVINISGAGMFFASPVKFG